MKLSRHDMRQQESRFYADAAVLLLNQIVAALTESTHLSAQDHGVRLLTNRVVEAIEKHLDQRLRIATLARDRTHPAPQVEKVEWTIANGRDQSSPDRARQSSAITARHIHRRKGYQVGVASPAQFSRMFRRVKGLTPKDYRRKYLERLPGQLLGGPPFKTEFLDGGVKEYDS
jgi:methylphosphotriester-DNA--protein-cysteine methyltransferase